MRPVCCVCTGRHHPASCVQAHAIFDQCAEPTPDDFRPLPAPTPSAGCALVDLDRYRRTLAAERKARWRAGRAS